MFFTIFIADPKTNYGLGWTSMPFLVLHIDQLECLFIWWKGSVLCFYFLHAVYFYLSRSRPQPPPPFPPPPPISKRKEGSPFNKLYLLFDNDINCTNAVRQQSTPIKSILLCMRQMHRWLGLSSKRASSEQRATRRVHAVNRLIYSQL